MAQIDILSAQVAALTQAFNDLQANARKTSEFPFQSPIVGTSLVRIEESGISKFVTLNQIVDKATSFLSNALLYFSGTTIVTNTVTLAIGSVWRISNVVYSNPGTEVFTVPYTSAPGLVRTDLLVGDDENNVTRIQGDESDIAIPPIYPSDKVVICSIDVTDSSTTPAPISSNKSVSYNVAVAATQDFLIPDGAFCQGLTVNEMPVPKKDSVSNGWVNNWEQINSNTVRIKKATLVNNRIHITYNI